MADTPEEVKYFWVIYQAPEKHKVGVETINKGTSFAFESNIYKTHYTDDPKRGLGQCVLIEADTAREAWNKALKIGMSRTSGKWSRPREKFALPQGTNGGVAIGIGYDPDGILWESPTVYVHFKTGNFYRLNGLYKTVIQDLFRLNGVEPYAD